MGCTGQGLFPTGNALWTYLTTPSSFAMPGFSAEEIDPWIEDGEPWKRLRAQFPPEIASHSREQDFYFGPDYLLRRHRPFVASGYRRCAICSTNPEPVHGTALPIRRRARYFFFIKERIERYREKLMQAPSILARSLVSF